VIHLGFWDWALLLIVSGQATLLAYLKHPKGKAIILTLPVPFTLAALAVGLPVSTTHVVALNLLLAFTHGVRWLHNRGGWPIILSIAAAAVGYCAAGALLRPIIPQSELSFWLACAGTLLVAAAAHALFPKQDEPDHRSPMAPWLKFPLVAAVILGLILIKRFLQGFMTMFPMVGVFAAYEARFSLGAVCRAIPDFMFAMVPLMAVVRLAQPRLGLGPALAAGWLIFLPTLIPMTRDL